MNYDPMLLSLALANASLGVIGWYFGRGQRVNRDNQWWLLACLLIALGLAGESGISGNIWIQEAVGFWAILTGLLLQSLVLAQVLQRRPHYRSSALLILLVIAADVFWQDVQSFERILVANASLVLVFSFLAYRYWLLQLEDSRLRLYVWLFLAAALATAIRLVHTLYWPQVWEQQLMPWPQHLVVVLASVCVLLSSLGYLLLLLERQNRQLLWSASRDVLTGCLNRQALEQAFAQRHLLAEPLVLVLIDLDHFKQVNDQLGHQAGDRVLQGFAQYVQQHIRQVDLFYRFGGEEFCLLMPELSITQAQMALERLRSGYESWSQRHLPLTCTFSAGLLSWPDSSIAAPAIMAQADQLLYQAKAQGRNQLVVNTQ